MWRCHECGGTGDRLSLVNIYDRMVNVTCVGHARYERIPFDEVPYHLLEDLDYLIEEANKIDEKDMLA